MSEDLITKKNSDYDLPNLFLSFSYLSYLSFFLSLSLSRSLSKRYIIFSEGLWWYLRRQQLVYTYSIIYVCIRRPSSCQGIRLIFNGGGDRLLGFHLLFLYFFPVVVHSLASYHFPFPAYPTIPDD